MEIKSIIQIGMILFLIFIFYLLGVRINIAVGDVTKTINNENQLNSFPSPTPSLPPNEVFEIDEILDSPRGILTQEMIDKKEQYPHHNPMMYKKTERVFLDNISS